MNLVRQLRDDIVDDARPVSSVLRKAKILATRLDDPEMKQWLSLELNGYPTGSGLPTYRRLYSALLGTFSGPFGSSVKNYSIPVSLLPDSIGKVANDLPIAHPVREIESMISSYQNGLRNTLPTEAVILSRGNIRMSGGMELVELYQPISRANLEGVLDAVRTRFLDFLLGLQELDKEILESEAALERLPREDVASTFNFTVLGDHNVIAPDSTFGDVEIQTVQSGDIGSLTRFLTKIGIPDEDRKELRDAIQQDGEQEPGTLGERVRAWIGSMISKALSGSWKIALGTAPEILKEAILRYYGWK